MGDYFSYIKDETSRKLTITLAALLEKESLDKITTSELLEQSGVSRSTFYRRYHDKYDLLTANYQQLLNATIGMVPDGMPYKTAFFNLYQVLKEHPVFFRNAFAYEGPNGLKTFIFKKSYKVFETMLRRQGVNMDSRYYQWLLSGYLNGALEISCRWIESGMKEPIDFLFRINYELIPHEIQMHLALSYT